MALTYVEIEQQKNRRIWLFFAVVVLFYFIIALILVGAAKLFFFSQYNLAPRSQSLLSSRTIINVLLFALITAIMHILYSISCALPFIQNNLRAVSTDASDKYHQRFKTIVEEVNVATGNKYKITPMVIPSLALNAFSISDYSNNAIVGVTEGLLSKLNRQQLQAVVAHEVAHVASADSLQTTVGCALFGIYATMLNGIRDTLKGLRKNVHASSKIGGMALVFLIFIYLLLSITQFFYTLIRMALSRNRELHADAIAVRLTRDPLSLSQALYAISRAWRGLGYIDNNLEMLFIINPNQANLDEQEGLQADLFATHPPISKRLKILAEMAHVQVNSIQQSVISQEKIRDSQREMPLQAVPIRWMLMDEQKQWLGPFTLNQLIVLEWVKPQTWIKQLDSDTLSQAKDEPLLKSLFSDKIKNRAVSSLNCPRCQQPLIEEDYEGARIYRCLFCCGTMVEYDKMSRIIIRREKGFDQRIKKMAQLTQKNGWERMRQREKIRNASDFKCQKCGAVMVKNFYTMSYLVEVDKCFVCGLVWLDKDELEMIQYLIENQEAV